jgi:hypothetical protein
LRKGLEERWRRRGFDRECVMRGGGEEGGGGGQKPGDAEGHCEAWKLWEERT